MAKTKIKIMLFMCLLSFLLVAFLGVSYAYYSVSITGNKSEAITLTSKAFLITYSDGLTSITGGNDGTTTTDLVYTKTFSVENKTPTGAYYEVGIGDYNVSKDGVDTSFERTEDWTYEIGVVTDTNSDGEITDADEISYILESGTLPAGDESVLTSRYLEAGSGETLRLVVTYDYITLEEGGTDQTADMGKTLSFNVVVNQVDEPKNLLANTIINNAKAGLNGTIFVEGSQLGIAENTTLPAKDMSLETEAILSTAEDDFTLYFEKASYFFRGNVVNNYINFIGMCWRVVRIQSDGSIKLILEDQYTTCDNKTYTGNWMVGNGNFGYRRMAANDGTIIYKMDFLEPTDDAETSMVKAFYDYQNILKAKIAEIYVDKTLADYLSVGNWCLNDSAYLSRTVDLSSALSLTEDKKEELYLARELFFYNSYVRLEENGNTSYGYSPTFKCNGTIIKNFKDVKYNGKKIIEEVSMYVNTITADEIVFAGGTDGGKNSNYYLINDFQKNGEPFWSLSPRSFNSVNDTAYIVYVNGSMNMYSILNSESFGGFRPAIILKNNITIDENVEGQNGTQEHPYVIAE